MDEMRSPVDARLHPLVLVLALVLFALLQAPPQFQGSSVTCSCRSRRSLLGVSLHVPIRRDKLT